MRWWRPAGITGGMWVRSEDWFVALLWIGMGIAMLWFAGWMWMAAPAGDRCDVPQVDVKGIVEYVKGMPAAMKRRPEVP